MVTVTISRAEYYLFLWSLGLDRWEKGQQIQPYDRSFSFDSVKYTQLPFKIIHFWCNRYIYSTSRLPSFSFGERSGSRGAPQSEWITSVCSSYAWGVLRSVGSTPAGSCGFSAFLLPSPLSQMKCRHWKYLFSSCFSFSLVSFCLGKVT